jgi:hypothetical protein
VSGLATRSGEWRVRVAATPPAESRRLRRRVASGRESRVPVSGEWRVASLASGDSEWRVVVADAGKWRVVWRLGHSPSGEWGVASDE